MRSANATSVLCSPPPFLLNTILLQWHSITVLNNTYNNLCYLYISWYNQTLNAVHAMKALLNWKHNTACWFLTSYSRPIPFSLFVCINQCSQSRNLKMRVKQNLTFYKFSTQRLILFKNFLRQFKEGTRPGRSKNRSKIIRHKIYPNFIRAAKRMWRQVRHEQVGLISIPASAYLIQPPTSSSEWKKGTEEGPTEILISSSVVSVLLRVSDYSLFLYQYD